MAILYHIFASLLSFQLHTFNSTRCIRNLSKDLNNTPCVQSAFNSTRCIRNSKPISTFFAPSSYTFNSTRCIRNQNTGFMQPVLSSLSTPHGALGTKRDIMPMEGKCRLSTPHGALGTDLVNPQNL